MSLQPMCAGCKYNHYWAPGGQKSFGRAETDKPHSRCLYFNAYIPMVVEKIKGCDGTLSAQAVRSEIPPGCPTFSQGSLLI